MFSWLIVTPSFSFFISSKKSKYHSLVVSNFLSFSSIPWFCFYHVQTSKGHLLNKEGAGAWMCKESTERGGPWYRPNDWSMRPGKFNLKKQCDSKQTKGGHEIFKRSLYESLCSCSHDARGRRVTRWVGITCEQNLSLYK